MTPAQRIRKAALGPTPKVSQAICAWVGAAAAWEAVYNVLPLGTLHWFDMTDTERRMLLLFVAEAIDE